MCDIAKTLLVNSARFSKGQATEIAAGSLVAFFLAQPLFGWLSEKVGRKAMLGLAYAGGGLVIWPVMTGITHTRSAGLGSP